LDVGRNKSLKIS